MNNRNIILMLCLGTLSSCLYGSQYYAHDQATADEYVVTTDQKTAKQPKQRWWNKKKQTTTANKNTYKAGQPPFAAEKTTKPKKEGWWDKVKFWNKKSKKQQPSKAKASKPSKDSTPDYAVWQQQAQNLINLYKKQNPQAVKLELKRGPKQDVDNLQAVIKNLEKIRNNSATAQEKGIWQQQAQNLIKLYRKQYPEAAGGALNDAADLQAVIGIFQNIKTLWSDEVNKADLDNYDLMW